MNSEVQFSAYRKYYDVIIKLCPHEVAEMSEYRKSSTIK